MKGITNPEDLMSLTKAELASQAASATDRFEEKKDELQKMSRLVRMFYDRAPMTLAEKLILALEIYGKLDIEMRDEEVFFSYGISAGWCTTRAGTLEEGLDRLLFLSF